MLLFTTFREWRQMAPAALNGADLGVGGYNMFVGCSDYHDISRNLGSKSCPMTCGMMMVGGGGPWGLKMCRVDVAFCRWDDALGGASRGGA
jgi:hypothetical protein